MSVLTSDVLLLGRQRRRRPTLVILSGVFVLVTIGCAFAGPGLLGTTAAAISPFNPGAPPSAAHLLGTDEVGRDVLARLVVGAGNALVGPLVIALSGLVISIAVGVSVGYLGGRVDNAVMRLIDFLLAFPGLLLIIVIVSVTGGGYLMALAVLAVLNAPSDIRIIRGAVLAQRPLPYIEALRVTGVPTWRILFRHIVRNVFPLLVADFALDFAAALVALAGLAFLGLGLPPGTADWGQMITESQQVLFSNPAASLAPAACVVLLAVSFNLLGDWAYSRFG